MSPNSEDRRRFFAPLTARFQRMPLWKRALLALVITPPLLAGGTAGAFYLRLHQTAQTANINGLPLFPSPEKTGRYLVLSPHCDDETLAVGGFIAEATSKGSDVSVAFLTNGDGFTAAADRDLKEIHVSPPDYVRFAEDRQRESLAAEKALGVPESQVFFLGYPDRGLRPMWETNWKENNLYRSAYTGHTHSPYHKTYTLHAPYCGASLENDLVRLMEQTKPTDIFVTHPSDDHPDHSAAPSFAQAALRICKTQKHDAWAQSAHIHYYIVHRGDWPLPQGRKPDAEMTVPPGLAVADTRWRAFILSRQAEKIKEAALSHYVSQLNITGRFLESFIRSNELFGEMDAPVVTSDRKDWTAVALDGRRDDVIRFVDPAADLTAISVRRAGADSLGVRVYVRGVAVPSRLQYTLLLRTGTSPTDATPVKTVQMTIPSSPSAHSLDVSIPLNDLGKVNNARYLWVAAETRWQAAANLPLRPVDRIGYRPFFLSATEKVPRVSLRSKSGTPTLITR